MKKRKRLVWVVVSSTVLLGTVGAFLYFATRENPDYVRAAKLLPEKKQQARDVFGPLSWEEYSEENGIVFRDDSAEWKRIEATIPSGVTEFLQQDPRDPEKSGELFVQNRDWFLGLSAQTAPILFDTPKYGVSFVEFLFPTKSLIKALATGIVGAADVGDIDAVAQLVRNAWSIIEKFSEQPDLVNVTLVRSNNSTIFESLLTAVSRNTDSDQLLTTARLLMDEAPAMPTVRAAMAGSARSNSLIFDLFRDEKQGPLTEKLDVLSTDFNAPSTPPSSPSFSDKVQEYITDFLGVSEDPRHTGANTLDALEARLWEVQLDHLKLSENALSKLPFRLDKLERAVEELEAKTDLSYEFAQVFAFPPEARQWMNYRVMKELSQLALAVMSKYPDAGSLPDSLSGELLIRDPFGEDNMLFKKTATGFIVYSRYRDGIDGGFAIRDKERLNRANAAVVYSDERSDYGIVVNYVLPIAIK